eukprot:GFKZ01000636.1.p2 GENE.GFKZ01000636.1~~GFKZ01000636.1.p2  ORF type:complete len:505 (+),score=74.65 GFKZ01000636.1:118-1632(+)
MHFCAFVAPVAISAVSPRNLLTSKRSFNVFTRPLNREANLHDVLRRGLEIRQANLFCMALPNIPAASINVLVVGSGGREHALVDSISKSPYLSNLYAAPGNVGMEPLCTCLPSVAADDIDSIIDAARKNAVSLVVIGPEVPLVLGLADRLQKHGILAFGPSKAAAILEGSKVFTKSFLDRHSIPTAWYSSFTDPLAAKAFVRQKGAPIVVKADGLAAGKGVILAKTVAEAEDAIDNILVAGLFGEAGAKVVIEEFLEGEEVSFFALLDGETALPLVSAQDHKAAYDGDTGPNTGGMGAYSPAPVCDEAMKTQIMESVVLPTMRGMKSEGREFRGVLYCGMMVDKVTKQAKVLEFNVRFGDPECQVLCKRMKSDLLELLYRTSKGSLAEDGFMLEWDPLSAVVIVLATRGYPGAYKKGSLIQGIEKANELDGVTVYHAGTKKSADGKFLASGGRVLGVTATGASIAEAQRKAYEGVDAIAWSDGFCRKDIGWRAIAREQAQIARS